MEFADLKNDPNIQSYCNQKPQSDSSWEIAPVFTTISEFSPSFPLVMLNESQYRGPSPKDDFFFTFWKLALSWW